MKITFNCWSADEIVLAFIEFLNEEIMIDYVSDKFGYKETMKGRLNIKDYRLKTLPKKLEVETRHKLTLQGINTKCKLYLLVDPEQQYRDYVELEFDNTLHKKIYNHFKDFEPVAF